MTPCRKCGEPSFGVDGLCTDCRPPRHAPYPSSPGYSNATTSRAAAESIAPHVSEWAAKVLAEIENEPVTAWQIEQRLKIRAQTITARLRELVLKNRIIDTGTTRPTRSGRAAIVWRIKTDEEKAGYVPPPSRAGNVKALNERIAYLEMLLTKEGIEYDDRT